MSSEPIPLIDHDYLKGTEPVVSISCIAYNQENFIRDAVEGFLMQKTTFPVEILIHDDASTDKTADIIREYEKKYPLLIKSIYQTENQYSQGIRPSKFNRERAKGKYYALCEGDDYWTDLLKLQKQVEYMEKHPEVSLSFHAIKKIDQLTGVSENIIANAELKNGFLELDRLLLGKWVHHTASFMVRSEVVKKEYPDFMRLAPVGDIALKLLALSTGKMGYLPDNMAVYRKFGSSSWSLHTRDIKWSYNWMTKYNAMLDGFDKYTSYKHSQIIRTAKKRQRIQFWKRSMKYLVSSLGLYSFAKKTYKKTR